MEQNENTLSVLKIAPGQYPQQVEIDNDLKEYQISVSRIEDLGFPPESLLSEEWIRANTPASSLTPPVKNGGDDYEGD